MAPSPGIYGLAWVVNVVLLASILFCKCDSEIKGRGEGGGTRFSSFVSGFLLFEDLKNKAQFFLLLSFLTNTLWTN